MEWLTVNTTIEVQRTILPFLGFVGFNLRDVNMEYLYSRLMPIVDLLNVAKQCSRFPLKLFRCFWLCQLWNEPLQNTKPLHQREQYWRNIGLSRSTNVAGVRLLTRNTRVESVGSLLCSERFVCFGFQLSPQQ